MAKLSYFLLVVCLAGGPGLPGRAEAADGAAVWKAQKCHTCHGEGGKGDTKICDKMGCEDMTSAAWQKKFTDADLKKATTEGVDREKNGKKQKMKGYSMGPEDLEALIKLMRSFGPK